MEDQEWATSFVTSARLDMEGIVVALIEREAQFELLAGPGTVRYPRKLPDGPGFWTRLFVKNAAVAALSACRLGRVSYVVSQSRARRGRVRRGR